MRHGTRTIAFIMGLSTALAMAQDRPPQGGPPRDRPARDRRPQDNGKRYSLEQATSDKAQLNTIAFDGLAFITGDFGTDIFAHQQLDGVVYQTLPVPADPNYSFYNKEAYRSGDILPGSGRLRVAVSAEKVRVEYVRSYLARDTSPQHPDGEVAFAYDLTPDRIPEPAQHRR